MSAKKWPAKHQNIACTATAASTVTVNNNLCPVGYLFYAGCTHLAGFYPEKLAFPGGFLEERD
jgi:hypothetical protein